MSADRGFAQMNMLSYADNLNQFLIIGQPATNGLLVGSQIINILSGIGRILSPSVGMKGLNVATK